MEKSGQHSMGEGRGDVQRWVAFERRGDEGEGEGE